MSKKHILLLHTGGTISMKENAAGSVAPDGANPIAEVVHIPGVEARYTVKEPFQLPSPHMNVEKMLVLKQEIEASDADGVVITHGTDTMEETAFFLHLTLNTVIPVVLTGAMRSSNEAGADGIPNLIAAVKTAASCDARDKGVLVVMNDSIHSAEFVTKTNSGSLDSFQSPSSGPIGTVLKSGPYFFFAPLKRKTYAVKELHYRVPILKAYAGMDAFLIEQLAARCDGVVIEAMGQGNVPPEAAKALLPLIRSGFPVVITSRCESGMVQPVYSYEGGGAALKEAGAFFAGGLNGPKARLKLIAALSAGYSEQLQHVFL
ncbi:asparaginase [Domibacillus sp. DTU_2020_1001157_1_SI_ALB_TIR_016]|uniref:asparaginase n=1 Tax=Domibacillus sp. DTU_2020_1001157_1_SI_ALB_TIR_016 TaxID=3077789 RepID=UPI0028E2D0FD|nr:asparaginase [Domibacillus sp. DTU_2020_1001157_1_SI_ALB_TIR_016]WNS82064.1 asparaginase [Domibacillus sp. DTU_2020_1001157_1_SI_ALB_TIR_016]